MEVLRPSPPPSPPLRLLRQGGGGFTQSGTPGEEKIYVAVGRSTEKTLGLLRWAFRRFGCREIGLLHVHQPSPLIPTLFIAQLLKLSSLLGKIPANQANEELVSSHRIFEREIMKKMLLNYMSYCHKAQVETLSLPDLISGDLREEHWTRTTFQVRVSVIVKETEHIQNGIVDIVTKHGIRKLVMGSTPDNFFKLKGSSRKAIFTAKNVPSFCEIWLIRKGRHIWKRDASDATYSFLSVCKSYDTVLREKFQMCSKSLNGEALPDAKCIALNTCINSDFHGTGMNQNRLNSLELGTSTTDSVFNCDSNRYDSQNPRSVPSSASCSASTFDNKFFPETISKDERDPEVLRSQLNELMKKVETSKKEAFGELAKRKQLESEIAEAFNRVKVYESAYRLEIKTRRELEGMIKSTKQQRDELASKEEDISGELQHIMDAIAILNSRVQEMALHMDKSATELKLIESTIEFLSLEKLRTQKQRMKSIYQIERSRSISSFPSPSCNWLGGLSDDSYSFTEFSVSDLQMATCNFSENFMLRQGGYWSVYKGEIRNRTVMIKKLHPYDVRVQIEFEEEIYALSKLKHPHLVTLIGFCPEAVSLVYEYMPGGSLQDHLTLCKTNSRITWKIRVRLAAEISSMLLFLHTSKPEKVVHGDLTPENIFLDESFHCKVGTLGIFQGQLAEHNLLFRRSISASSALPYADPDYITEESRPKSDVCAFGVIILQLLTRRSQWGLASEVRRALLSGNLSSILDSTAGEWPSDVARKLAELGLQFCEPNSRNRSELTPEIVRALGQLQLEEERPLPPYFLCPIFKEIMLDPQVATDGFTYEGRALRGWFDSGGDTSPMTNLKLRHLNVTPNHALRFAIQDWLCQL